MISLNWVKDYVDLDNIDLKDLATQITILSQLTTSDLIEKMFMKEMI